MKHIYTIGFTKKNAERFFELLSKNNVKKIIDVRLNNSSQLAGFAKGEDLKYFLKKICNIDYIHEIDFAPTKELLNSYKKNNLSWEEYECVYRNIIEKRHLENYIKEKGEAFWVDSCLLCSEDTPEKCHRRLVAEIIKRVFIGIDEKDLI